MAMRQANHQNTLEKHFFTSPLQTLWIMLCYLMNVPMKLQLSRGARAELPSMIIQKKKHPR